MSQRSGVIVVGVDGSPQGDAALAFALQEAARWGDAVRAVTAWHVDLPAMSYPTLPQAGTPPSRSELKAHAEDIQRRALERAAFPAMSPCRQTWSRVWQVTRWSRPHAMPDFSSSAAEP